MAQLNRRILLIRNLLIAFISASALSGVQIWASIKFSQKILWQVKIMHMLVGPGPVIGYYPDGRPMYEGTPVHMLAAYLGLFLGVMIYAVIFYWLKTRILKT